MNVNNYGINTFMFYGYQVISNSFMIEPNGFESVKRTWKERLFTFQPWNPLKKYRNVTKYKPMEIK